MQMRVITDQPTLRARGFVTRNRWRRRKSVQSVIGIIAVFALWNGAVAAEQQHAAFEVPKKDTANAQELANHLAALSPRVDRNEARLLADCAYATVARLRHEYRMFGTPIFNNFLVYHGWRKRGYCYQWTEDLLLALDTLKLKTLELHWGDTYPGHMAREQLPGRYGERTTVRARDDSRVLASFWTSPLESRPVRSGPILREHEMGGKGPRTCSLEYVPGQSWCCVPNKSRTATGKPEISICSDTAVSGGTHMRSPRTFPTVIRHLTRGIHPAIACRSPENGLRKTRHCHKLRCR